MYKIKLYIYIGFPGGIVVKSPPANAGDAREENSIPGSRRTSGVENGNSLQYFCLENSMDREAWRATVYGSQRVGYYQAHIHIYDLSLVYNQDSVLNLAS